MGMGRLRIWRSGSRITGFRRRENWWGRSVPLDLPGRADSARNLGCDVAGKRFLQNGATRFEVRLAGSAVFTKRTHAESGAADRKSPGWDPLFYKTDPPVVIRVITSPIRASDRRAKRGIRRFTKRTHAASCALGRPFQGGRLRKAIFGFQPLWPWGHPADENG